MYNEILYIIIHYFLNPFRIINNQKYVVIKYYLIFDLNTYAIKFLLFKIILLIYSMKKTS
jgi:hypothetical protein